MPHLSEKDCETIRRPLARAAAMRARRAPPADGEAADGGNGVDRSAGMTISDKDFVKFRDFYYKKTGSYFEDSKRYFVDKRLIERMQATGCATFREYFSLVRFQASGEEFQHLVNAMTVNETYFFREDHQLRSLVGPVLDEILRYKKPGDLVRIWSIPCSTGEEPYSLALYLLEYWEHIDRMDVEIVASDIDSNVLARCREGIYGARSMQHVPDDIRRRHFRPVGDGRWQISSDIRSAVTFTLTNLNDAAATRRFRNFDVIFCRNLLIYFDDASRRRAAITLYDALAPGGFVFLGHSESMSRVSAQFTVRRFPEAIVYQKPRN